MLELIQMWFIDNQEFSILVMIVTLMFSMLAVFYSSLAMLKKFKHAMLGVVILTLATGLWGFKFIIINVIGPASDHMINCEISTVSIKSENLNINYDRDITLCQERVDWNSDEFSAWVLNGEHKNLSRDRSRNANRCGIDNISITVNSDLIQVSNSTMPVEVCISYSDVKLSNLYKVISE